LTHFLSSVTVKEQNPLLNKGGSAPAVAEDFVLRNQLVSIDGKLVWCDWWLYDEDTDEIEVCIPDEDDNHEDDHDDEG
jgi:hypothetical protein